MSLILDTDHCIEVLRGRLDMNQRVSPGTSLYVTAVTVGELVFGACKSDRPEYHLSQVQRLLDSVTILSYDHDAGHRYGQLKDKLRRTGQLLAEPDLQIASIALSRALPLATHNTRHFARVHGLELIDWI